MSTPTRAVAEAYVAAWTSKNLNAIGALLSSDVRFKGPLSELEGKDAVLASFAPLLPMLNGFEVRQIAESAHGCVLIYDFVMAAPVGPIRIAEALTIERDQIVSCELFFDPRPLLAAR